MAFFSSAVYGSDCCPGFPDRWACFDRCICETNFFKLALFFPQSISCIWVQVLVRRTFPSCSVAFTVTFSSHDQKLTEV